jgi:uncharacterized peroxidase-related enzyme
LLKDDELLAAVEVDWRTSSIDERRKAMLGYVEKLTIRPQDVTIGDVDALRTEGFTDRDIHDICEVAAYYAYVNRISDGLGVQLETWLAGD